MYFKGNVGPVTYIPKGGNVKPTKPVNQAPYKPPSNPSGGYKPPSNPSGGYVPSPINSAGQTNVNPIFTVPQVKPVVVKPYQPSNPGNSFNQAPFKPSGGYNPSGGYVAPPTFSDVYVSQPTISESVPQIGSIHPTGQTNVDPALTVPQIRPVAVKPRARSLFGGTL